MAPWLRQRAYDPRVVGSVRCEFTYKSVARISSGPMAGDYHKMVRTMKDFEKLVL